MKVQIFEKTKIMNPIVNEKMMQEVVGLPPATQHELRWSSNDGTLHKTAIIDLKKHFVAQNGSAIFLKQICSTLIPEKNFCKTIEQYWMRKKDHWVSIPEQQLQPVSRWEYLPFEATDFAF